MKLNKAQNLTQKIIYDDSEFDFEVPKFVDLTQLIPIERNPFQNELIPRDLDDLWFQINHQYHDFTLKKHRKSTSVVNKKINEVGFNENKEKMNKSQKFLHMNKNEEIFHVLNFINKNDNIHDNKNENQNDKKKISISLKEKTKRKNSFSNIVKMDKDFKTKKLIIDKNSIKTKCTNINVQKSSSTTIAKKNLNDSKNFKSFSQADANNSTNNLHENRKILILSKNCNSKANIQKEYDKKLKVDEKIKKEKKVMNSVIKKNKDKENIVNVNFTMADSHKSEFIEKHSNSCLYVPPLHGTREIRKWEKISGKTWYKLNSQERLIAIDEINDMLKEGKN